MSDLLNLFSIGDWILFIFGLISVVNGYRWGVMRQITFLLCLFCGIWFAVTYSASVSQFLVDTWSYMAGQGYIKTLGFVVAFLIAYLVALLVLTLITRVIGKLPLGFVGKLLGVVVALAKLWAVMGLLVIICSPWPWFQHLFPEGSYGLAFGKSFVRLIGQYSR